MTEVSHPPLPGIPRSHRFACSRPLTLREGGLEGIWDERSAASYNRSGQAVMVGES